MFDTYCKILFYVLNWYYYIHSLLVDIYCGREWWVYVIIIFF
jgi:hypothetical protein